MHWLHALDVGVLRFVNETLSNPVFDTIMPIASGKGVMPFLFPVFLVTAILLIWRGGTRGRLCVLMLALIVWPGDSFVCNLIKHAVARPRPFLAVPDLHVLVGRGGSFSMPSSHAANWFSATMIFFLYFRRSAWVMLPMACLVSFSRLYNGAHYPSDVLAGAILGAGYAVAGVWALNALWQWAARRWFPLWWERLPSLVVPECSAASSAALESRVGDRQSEIERHWLRLGYVLIVALFLARLTYIASGLIGLSQDEAYQWVWSKHLALSYYSKPPLIAYTQFLGTSLWGDNEFGIRFFSPVIGAILGLMLLRFFAREVNARAGFFLLLIITATPLMGVGAVLMTIDPLSVLFWTAAMIAGWRAVQPEAKTGPWLWAGLWMGLGFLSKYTEMFQWLCWLAFFILWKPARAHLRKPGPYLALLINLVCAAPVLIWNQQHHWITAFHVASDAAMGTPWHPTLRHFFDFIGQESALLNPVFFIATIWAAIAFWRRGRHNPRLVYLFSMGAPLFLSYLLWTFHSGVLPNWIAPSVLPLFCVMVIYWDTRLRLGVRGVKAWLIAGLSLGLFVTAVLHDTDLVQKLVGRPLPPKIDPLTRVRAYRSVAETVGAARTQLLAEGKPVFIIGNHYGITSLVTFYLPEAKTNVVRAPLVYFQSSDHPVNQYYFWPGYEKQRRGQNAIFVRELGYPPLVKGWFFKWLAGEKHLRRYQPKDEPAPNELVQQFDSVTDLGLFTVLYHGRIFHTIQLFDCRDLH